MKRKTRLGEEILFGAHKEVGNCVIKVGTMKAGIPGSFFRSTCYEDLDTREAEKVKLNRH